MVAEKLVEIQNLTFIYPEADGPALKDISFAVNKGEFIGITGPTGAGKSTLSLCFNGVIPHFQAGRMAGRCLIGDKPVADIPNREMASLVGSVFQDPEAQIVSLTVEEEIAFGMENLGFSREVMVERIDEVLEITGIAHLRERSTTSLSGGQKQRLVIAAVLAMRPQIIVLDEPTSELDPLGTEDVFQTLRKLNRELGITIILIEQRIDQLAGYLDRLLVLDKGSLVADGDPRTVLANPEVVALGVKLPQVTEFALLMDPRADQVPVTLEQGIAFAKDLTMGRRS